MVVKPGVNVLRIPEVAPIAATDVVLLVHTPPVMPSDKIVELPVQTEVLPVMAVGEGVTVTVFVTVQPEPRE